MQPTAATYKAVIDESLYLSPDLNGEGLHIGIIRARFNEEIGQAELDACLEELAEAGRAMSATSWLATVPGALELGVTLAHMAETYRIRRADRPGRGDPRRNLPFRGGQQRDGDRHHPHFRWKPASPSPMAC